MLSAGIMQARQVFNRANCVMDGRQLGRDDDRQAIRLANSGTGVLAESRRRIDNDELVALGQKCQGVLNGIRRGRVKRLYCLWSVQHMESARVLQQEALQQFGVKSVHVVNQLVKAILMAPQSKTQ